MQVNRIAAVAVSVLVIGAWSAGNARGEELGAVIHNGVEMKVMGAVAVWDAGKTQLKVHLLPFVPTEEEIDLCRRGRESRIDRSPIDAERWPDHNPRASYSISWSPDDPIGSHDQSTVFLYAYGIGAANANVNLNYLMKYGSENVEGTLTGKLAEGETIRLVTKGKDKLNEEPITWDLSMEIPVYTRLPRGE